MKVFLTLFTSFFILSTPLAAVSNLPQSEFEPAVEAEEIELAANQPEIEVQAAVLGVEDNQATDQRTEVVKIGVYDNKPKIYRDEYGEIKGIWADITNYIAEQEGWEFEYVHGTWNDGLERLENGEIDFFVDVALSEPRKEKYDFNNETILINWAAVYARKGVEINSMYDLKDKKIAVMKSGIHFNGPLGIKSLMDSFGIEAEYVDVDVYGDVFSVLDKGEVDAGVVNRVFGISNEMDYPNIQRTTVVFNPIELRYAFTKDDPRNDYLITVIDQNLYQLKSDSDSVYYQTIKENLRGVTQEVPVIPVWIKTAAIIAGVVFVLLMMMIVFARRNQKFLKKEVDIRTSKIQETNKKLETSLKELKKQKKDLEAKTKELQRVNDVMVNRELAMLELKKASKKKKQ